MMEANTFPGYDLANIDTMYENELFHSWFWRGQLSSTDTLWTGMVYEKSVSKLIYYRLCVHVYFGAVNI